VDVKVLESRVQGLNAALEQELSDVGPRRSPGNNICQLRSSAPEFPLTFFRDGLKLADRPFTAYELRPAQDLIRDVLDGYFPRVLKDEHPDGVLLKVIDRTGHTFQAWFRQFSRDDPELADGGERLKPSAASGVALRAPADSRSAEERLLAKLPERVIKGGRICEVRNAIADKLGVVQTPGPGANIRSLSAPPKRSSSTSSGGDVNLLRPGREEKEPLARLQVKLEAGQKVLLRMEPDATIGGLWEALATWRMENCVPRAQPGSMLRTAFPPKSYSDLQQTLAAAGLVPSATLFVSTEVA